MNRTYLILVPLAMVAGVAVRADDPSRTSAVALPPAASGAVDFERDIRPIFAQTCVKCHGPEKQKGGLRLDLADAARKGGNSGAAINPGDAAHSRLLLLVAGLDPELKMPPTGKPLSREEVGRLRAWIDQGARWPKILASPESTGAKSKHWAFLPPKRWTAPIVLNRDWVCNEIDAFVLGRLEAERIAPSPEADRMTLIRRLSLDLLGLPPTPQDVKAFVNDPRPDAYEHLVDRLLDSPHYGERWGRHWLDLARYADSDGFEKDTGRPHAWRYRDWVIYALNRDQPFDQFTIEQLAGDMLPNPTLDRKVATGFHRNTLTNTEGGVDREQFRVEQVVDRVNTTAKVFLGLTLGCAQCHDHKYDPFSQREYYQFSAFFNSDQEVDVPVASERELATYKEKKAVFDKQLAVLQSQRSDYMGGELLTGQKKWEESLTLADLRGLPAEITAILLIDPTQRTAKQRKELTDHYGKSDKKLTQLNKAITAHQKTAPDISRAQTLALGSPRKTHVLIRGDFLRPGVEVESGTPAVLPALKVPTSASRLDLARWIVATDNPLTPRVIVNWMWHHYFGRGLVATLEDFGTQGERPSHPELLDWLATEFVRHRWSMKAMHRLIVTSATYRQSSAVRPELLARDPLNILLARQSRLRLEAEVIRDVALVSSGLLAPQVGGPSVRPPQPPGISELTYAGSARWVESSGLERYRRGMYTWFQRTSPYPMLMTFDVPDSNVCCVRRERSNTPLQALTLLNDTVFVECAQALGRSMLQEPKACPEDRIQMAFRTCLARDPTVSELEVLTRMFREMQDICKAQTGRTPGREDDDREVAAWTALARTILNLDEFVTRE